MVAEFVIGAILGLLCLLPFFKVSIRMLAQNGHIALAMMLMIYLGAHLVSSDDMRQIQELIFTVLVLGLGFWWRSFWPLGLGLLILFHSGYDYLFGAASGVPAWYPPLCAGFDIVVGLGLIGLIYRVKRQQNQRTLPSK